MTEQFGAFAAAQAADASLVEIGRLLDVAGAGSRITLDERLLAHLQDDPDDGIATAGQVGGQVKIAVGARWLLCTVRTLGLDGQGVMPGESMLVAQIDFIGEGTRDPHTGRLAGFRRGVTRYPLPGSPVFPVTTDELRQLHAAQGRAHIEIGTVYPTRDIRAALYVDALLGKHFALLGSTGTGKSTATALILHRICALAPQGHIVMIDPHGEYPAAFGDTGEIFNVDNLAMPYWLMNFAEHVEVFVTSAGAERQTDADILAKCLLAARAKNRAAEGVARLTVDSPTPYLLSDLLAILQAEMGKMDKATGSAPYQRLKTKIEEMRADPRYAFMLSGMLVSDSLAAFIGRIFRLPGEGRPISIVDVSGVPGDITDVVVAVLARLVFDYAIWARGEAQRPVLLVCEEAHRYIPSDRVTTGAAVRRTLERIAKEGRKYGVSLGLVTQRPSDLAEGVLSQCGTIITMRLNNERDQAFVRGAMPEGSRGFLDAIPALRNRECVVTGEGVAMPVRVVLDDLAETLRPASNDPSFAALWREAGDEPATIARVVHRWRNQRL